MEIIWYNKRQMPGLLHPERVLGPNPARRRLPASTRRSTLPAVLGANLLLLGLGGCSRGRAVTGGAFSAADIDGHSGVLVGADVLVRFNRLPAISRRRDLPLALHVSGETVMAQEVMSFSLGTGVAVFHTPDPVAPYLIIGTSAHTDRVEGHYSVGNLSPYSELGVAAPLSANPGAMGQGIFTLGIGSMLLLNYLLPPDRTVSAYYTLKFGFGYDAF